MMKLHAKLSLLW